MRDLENEEMREAGAAMLDAAEELFSAANIILRIDPKNPVAARAGALAEEAIEIAKALRK